LKDKMGTLSALGSAGSENASTLRSLASSPHADAVGALMALCYKPADADQRIRKAISTLGNQVSTEALIKAALN
ncbi:MAG TPA: RuvA C-terminal domain-containing protein, partial [Opitutales bacterium]|nr:RuvA C-terminal domain-containing protein [Opitutales bacterium]